MRRFHWPLQRLLDVTEQRERAARAELLALARETVACRRQIVQHQQTVRLAVRALSEAGSDERPVRQEVVMASAAASRRRIARLQQQLDELEQKRQAKGEKLVRLKRQRETYEKMRERARREHLAAEEKLEQARLEEAYHTAFAKAAARRAADGAVGA